MNYSWHNYKDLVVNYLSLMIERGLILTRKFGVDIQ
jgi:hypothetical protein